MARGKHKKHRNPRVAGTITSVQSASFFTIDEDKEVRVGPKTRFSGVAVGPSGLLVGQQVKCVGHKNQHKDFVADKVNVTPAGQPAPEEPTDPEEEETPPTPDIEPEPQPEPPVPDTDEDEDTDPEPAPEQEEESTDENATEEGNA